MSRTDVLEQFMTTTTTLKYGQHRNPDIHRHMKIHTEEIFK
jgi:hypothetical protein